MNLILGNITYILNTLKSYVDKTELNKPYYIFNSKFNLDNKKSQTYLLDYLEIFIHMSYLSH